MPTSWIIITLVAIAGAYFIGHQAREIYYSIKLERVLKNYLQARLDARRLEEEKKGGKDGRTA